MSSRTFRLVTAVLAALAGIVAAAQTIPPVAERDPNPETSPRIVVREIVLHQFRSFAHLGITDASVSALLRDELKRAHNAATPAEHGFTQPELEELAELLSVMGVHDAAGEISEEEAAELVRLVRGQKTRRGISIVELERIAERLAEFYREHGLFLTAAFVPSQEVVDGQVELRVLTGELAEVNVTDPLIQEAFEHLIGEPVERRQIESILFSINRLPGVQAQGVFSAGAEVGETKLDLALTDTRAWRGDVRLDNHGDPHTGEQRLRAEYGRGSLLRNGDDLSVGVLATVDPSDARYAWARYEIPISTLRNRWFVELGSNTFSWDPAAADFDGDGRFATFGMRRIFAASRTRAFAGQFSLSRHDLALSGVADQDVGFATGAVSTSWVFDGLQLAVDGDLSLDFGRIGSGALPGQSEDVWRARGFGRAWRLVPVPGFAVPQKISLSLTGQLADDRLPDSLRMVMGGAQRVRAFDPSDTVVDSGLVMNLDLRLSPARLQRYGDLLLFVDAAYGESFGAFEDYVNLSAVGLGFDWRIGNRARSVISWAVPTSQKGLRGPDAGSTLYWTLTYAP